MTAWITIVAAGLVSFGLRAAPARWAGRHELPAHWQPRLALLGPAAFAALAAPAVAYGHGPDGSAMAGLAAIAVAAPVARVTRSTAATLAAGMPVLWLVTALTGA